MPLPNQPVESEFSVLGRWEGSHDAHDAMVGAVAHAAQGWASCYAWRRSCSTSLLLRLRLLRLLLLPVLLRLAGRASWAPPAWLTRIRTTVRFRY